MPPAADPPSSAFAACWQSAARFAAAEALLGQSLNSELASAREALMDSARQFLPGYLVFASGGIRDLLARPSQDPLPPRKKSARARERHLLLYLQRICGKNDTLSEFGPQGWGRIDSTSHALALDPQAGIARRETFLERWAAHGAAAAINADPQAGVELAPRLHPDGRIEQDHFIHTPTGEIVPLDPETLALLARCDGTTPRTR